MKKWLLKSMTELTSRKWISQITGAFAQSRLSRSLIKTFAKTYNIQIDEAEMPIEQYRTLNEFFTRRLKPNMRTIDTLDDGVVSPVDALITSCGTIEDGLLLNVKGQQYSVAELLESSEQSKRYDHGFYFVLYLSPTDYHRIHTPVAGNIVKRQHLPGKVYPVNNFGLTHMKQVLSRNERLVSYIKSEFHTTAVVKVGAMNVSSIHYVNKDQQQFVKGEELAYFAFGSTVVLLLESNVFECDPRITTNKKVRMGERLGVIKVNN